jgi:replicative DNA helicase
MTIYDFAVYYVKQLKFSVIPIKPKDKKPFLHSWKEFQKRKATTAELKKWFKNTDNNIAIVTGKISGGLVVVDLDSNDAMLWAIDKGFPKTAQVQTGRGYQLFYKSKIEVRNFQARKDLPGIDLRGDGGYVVAPPSIHPNGKTYKWTQPPKEDFWPLAPLPDFFVATPGTPEQTTVLDLYDEGAGMGERNMSLARMIGSWIHEGEPEEEIEMLAFAYNNLKCSPPLDEKEVLTTIKSLINKARKDAINGKQKYKPKGTTIKTKRTIENRTQSTVGNNSSSTCSAESDVGESREAEKIDSTVRPAVRADVSTSGSEQEQVGERTGKHNGSSSGTVEDNNEWPEIIRIDKPGNNTAFPLESIPEPYREYIKQISNIVAVDPALPGSIFLAVISTCWQKRVKVQLRNEYIEPVNLYLCPVLRPGERKSATLQHIIFPIVDAQFQDKENSKIKIAREKSQQKLKKMELEKLNRGWLKALEHERQGLEEPIAQLSMEIDNFKEPSSALYIAQDTTSEALGYTLLNNDERVAIMSAEGGIFDTLGGMYSASHQANMDIFLQAYDGAMLRVDRITRETVEIQNPTLTCCLVVQPHVVEQIGQNLKMNGRGFLGRWLYSICDSKIGSRYLNGTDPVIDKNLKTDYEFKIKAMLSASVPKEPEILSLTPEAAEMWKLYYNDTESQMKPEQSLFYMSDWGSKHSGRVGRIAALLHLAQHGPAGTTSPVSSDTMGDAMELGAYYMEHAIKAIEGVMAYDETFKNALMIADYLSKRKERKISSRGILRNINKFKSIEPIHVAFEILRQRGYIRPENALMLKTKVGRPEKVIYDINPALKVAEK